MTIEKEYVLKWKERIPAWILDKRPLAVRIGQINPSVKNGTKSRVRLFTGRFCLPDMGKVHTETFHLLRLQNLRKNGGSFENPYRYVFLFWASRMHDDISLSAFRKQKREVCQLYFCTFAALAIIITFACLQPSVNDWFVSLEMKMLHISIGELLACISVPLAVMNTSRSVKKIKTCSKCYHFFLTGKLASFRGKSYALCASNLPRKQGFF